MDEDITSQIVDDHTAIYRLNGVEIARLRYDGNYTWHIESDNPRLTAIGAVDADGISRHAPEEVTHEDAVRWVRIWICRKLGAV